MTTIRHTEPCGLRSEMRLAERGSKTESALSQAVASGDAFEHRPSECGHCVQDFLAEFDLRDLPGEVAGFESEADDTLPTAVCVYIRLRWSPRDVRRAPHTLSRLWSIRRWESAGGLPRFAVRARWAVHLKRDHAHSFTELHTLLDPPFGQPLLDELASTREDRSVLTTDDQAAVIIGQYLPCPLFLLLDRIRFHIKAE